MTRSDSCLWVVNGINGTFALHYVAAEPSEDRGKRCWAAASTYPKHCWPALRRLPRSAGDWRAGEHLHRRHRSVPFFFFFSSGFSHHLGSPNDIEYHCSILSSPVRPPSLTPTLSISLTRVFPPDFLTSSSSLSWYTCIGASIILLSTCPSSLLLTCTTLAFSLWSTLSLVLLLLIL